MTQKISKTYPDLLQHVGERLNQGPYKFTMEQIRNITDTVFESIMDLIGEPNVKKMVTPIGVFDLYNRPAYTGKHPKTREPMHVAEKTLLKYRPSTDALRRLANRGDVRVDTSSLYVKKKGA